MTETAKPEQDTDRRHRKKDDILRAAAQVFWTHGFTAGTTKEIAERVGLSQPTIYHYIGSKRALLEGIAAAVHLRVVSALQTARVQSSDPRAQLGSIVLSLVLAITEDPEMFGVFWQEFRQLPAAFQIEVQNDERELLHQLESLIRAIQSDGGLAPERPPAVVASVILGSVSWIYQWYRPSGASRPDEIAATILELCGIPADSAI